MIHLILHDLRRRPATRLGPLVTIVLSALVLGLGIAFIDTGLRQGGESGAVKLTSGASIAVGGGITAVLVMSATMRLASDLRRPDYARWQLAGVSPSAIRLVVLCQAALLGLIGSALACGAGAVLIPAAATALDQASYSPSDVHIPLSGSGMLVLVGTTTALAMFASLASARSAAATPAIVALRESTPPATRMTRLRWATLLAAVIALGLTTHAMITGERAQTVYFGIMLGPVCALLLTSIGPLVFPAALYGWTALIPPTVSSAWYLARHSARHKALHSSAGITTLLLGITLVGSITAVTNTATNALTATREAAPDYYSFDRPGVLSTIALLVGGPVLLASAAAAVVVFIAGHDRTREEALLRATGATTATVMLRSLYEAAIYAGTAFLLGLLSISTTACITAAAFSIKSGKTILPAVDLGPPTAVFCGGFILVLLATVIPTLLAVRDNLPRRLASI